MQFKIGKSVCVRHHTEEEKQRYWFLWEPSMDMFEGQIATVIDVGITDDDERAYQIKIGDTSHVFLEVSLSSIGYDVF